MKAFTQTDCWVLFSIGFNKRGSTLKQIISTGDILNHAIITRKELETSLNKLLLNDYIIFSNGSFSVTDKAISFYETHRRDPEGCIVQWLRISEILKQQPTKKGKATSIKISDEDYKESLGTYYANWGFKSDL